MSQFPNNPYQPPQGQPVFVQPPVQPQQPQRPRRVWRLRWAWLLVPAVIVLAIWMAGGIEPSVSFEELATWFGVEDVPRYRSLALLGCLAVAAVVVAKALRRKD